MISEMPLVQLSRLRSQLNALEVHFKNPEMFRNSLISLFLVYENKKSSTNIWLKNNSLLSAYNIPESVMSELESRLEVLAQLDTNSALKNADNLWNLPFYEPKKAAISLVSNLPDSFDNEFLERIQNWLSVELGETLTKDLISTVETKAGLLQSSQWMEFIKKWLYSREPENIKLGLCLLNKTLSHGYHNLPMIFSVLSPLLNKPPLIIHKELGKVIKGLISLSEAETASFLIMTSNLFQEGENLKFLRKCLPLFDNFFQKEIRSSLTNHSTSSANY